MDRFPLPEAAGTRRADPSFPVPRHGGAATLRERIVRALRTRPELDARHIDVFVARDEIILTGTVPGPVSEQRALAVAAGAAPSHAVQSRLQVLPPPSDVG